MRINKVDVVRFSQPLGEYAKGRMSGKEACQEILCQAIYLSAVTAEDLVRLALDSKKGRK